MKIESGHSSLPIVLVMTLMAMVAGCSSGTRGQRFVSVQNDLSGIEIPEFSDGEDIVVHLGYVASYNHTTLTPDWVAWELTADEVSDAYNFQCSFSRDPSVEFPKASREDYSSSGWDKGHMAPRADMKWSAQALEESYYFTNICPQNHAMNSGAWRKIEELTRRLARHYGAVYVVCGPVAGTGRFGTIGQACVQVPDAYFKALAVSTDEGFSTVGFLVANDHQDGSPRSYAVPVDSVEAVIGRNLFPQVPEEAEAHYDWSFWKH